MRDTQHAQYSIRHNAPWLDAIQNGEAGGLIAREFMWVKC